jgi:hypothetical protein
MEHDVTPAHACLFIFLMTAPFLDADDALITRKQVANLMKVFI